MMRINKFFY